jgi:hypothetical protein
MIVPFLRLGVAVPAEGDSKAVMGARGALRKSVEGGWGGGGGEESGKKKKACEYQGRGQKHEANQEVEQAFVDAWMSSPWVSKYKTYT